MGAYNLGRSNSDTPGTAHLPATMEQPSEDVGFEVFYDNTEEDLVCNDYYPVKGDIAIFMPIASEVKNGLMVNLHKHGHIQMFDGKVWISDFQQSQFFVGKDYRVKYGRFRIYRYTDLMCKSSQLPVTFSR